MEFTTIMFGKYKEAGVTVPQLVINDPNYLSYIVKSNFLYGPLRDQAKAVYTAATQLRLPEDKRESHRIQYLTHTGKLAAVNVVRCADVSRLPATNEFRSERLNLLQSTDTIGRKLIQEAFRTHWMKGKKLTKEELETFFGQPLSQTQLQS